nr:uncharacterized protein LOC109163026 [Ipomoea batatas]
MQQKVHKNMSSWEEFDGDDEDNNDVFYAEIRRQVMQLTAEDEDEENQNTNRERGSSKQKGFTVLQPGFQFNWTGVKDGSRVPQWMVDLWRKENRDGGFSGTGVFIPHIVKSRRRHKPRRKNNERGRVYKPVTKVN